MVWRPNSRKLYRALLLAWPAEFRHEFAPEMERLFADRLRSEPPVRVWRDALADLLFHAPEEHLRLLSGDLRHGARLLAKAPAFALTAIFAMALGIGAATAVFSLINAVLLRSLPYRDPPHLAYIWTPNPRFQGAPRELGPDYADFLAWRQSSRSFSDLAIFAQTTFHLTEGAALRRAGGAYVDGGFFQTLGAAPQLGRTITPADDRPGHETVAVISDAFWHSHFAADPAALGARLALNRRIYTVIGVMPQPFAYPRAGDFPHASTHFSATDIWIPAAWAPDQQADSVAIGRLRPGAGLSRAQTEIGAIEARLDLQKPAEYRGWTALVMPFADTALGALRPRLWLLLGAEGLLLAIACLNVATLLTARAAGRSHELGVRSALGAHRSRLVRQLVTEAMLLAAGGGALGVLLAYGAVRALVRFGPADIPRLNETSLDARVLLVSIAASLLTGLLFGLMPALSASRISASQLLQQGGSRGSTGSSRVLQNGLIAAQVALAMVLLTGAGLLVRSYWNVQRENRFDGAAFSMKIDWSDRYATLPKQVEFMRTLFGQLSALPEVKLAGTVNSLPLSNSESLTFVEVKGYPNRKDQMAAARTIAGRYFEALRIPLLAGRLFNGADTPDRPRVVLISRQFARVYFAGRDPLGQQVRAGGPNSPWATVAGVVADVHHASLEDPPTPTIYGSFWQAADFHPTLIVQPRGDPGRAAAPVRRLLKSLDPGLDVIDVQTMGQLVSGANGRRQFQTVALAAFAAAAIFLALVGVYGLMAHAVRRRTAEIGIRIALGASPAAVVAMVLRQGLALIAAGLAAGLAASFALTRLIAAWLYGVAAIDPLTFAVVPLFIVCVGAAACLVPAWKAARIDPITTLRC